jgi:glycosyltransferase involved in cell wall biosynthesis
MAERLPVVLDARVVTGAGGGPEKTILNSPRLLREFGYRMICAYLHPPGDSGFDVLRAKAQSLDAPLESIPDRGPWDWRVLRKLLQLCRREQVAIYHGHDYKSNLLGLVLKRFWPMRLVTTAHGWVKHTARTPLYYRIDKWCLPRYEQVICVSGDLMEACQRAGVSENRCVLLENGIDLAAYRRTQSLSEAKRALGFDPDRPLVGAVGRLSPEKGFDILIDAIVQLQAAGSPVQLVIVGEGGEQARLQAKIDALGLNPHCRLAGFQAEPKPVYEAMDLFALSSLREGLPNVLLEAMALGVPCVATRIAGVPRLIQDGENGRLVEPNDVQMLAGAIRNLLGEAAERQRLGLAGQATIAERYSFARRMEKLAAIYDQLLGVQCSVS